MNILMRPLVKEERNEAQKYAKVKARLQQADTIFKRNIDLIFPKDSQVFFLNILIICQQKFQ